MIAPAPQAHTRRSSTPPCVALAEDDAPMRALIASALGAVGYSVVELRNGSELLEYMASTELFRLRHPRPSLIVTDLDMPGYTGIEVIQGLKRARLWAPTILITGFGTIETRRRAQHLGVAAVFEKPFDIDDLCRVATRLVPLGNSHPA